MDYRFLYGMQKTAAQKQAEFKSTLRGYFQKIASDKRAEVRADLRERFRRMGGR